MSMLTKKYDYLVVGSGLFGSVFAHQARQAGKRCLVVEKRSHLGGNVHCQQVEGITVHQYGAHIFHTSNKEVWDFVNRLVDFHSYVHSPVAFYRGKEYALPFNMNTFQQMWGVTTPEEAMRIIEEQRNAASAGVEGAPRNLEEQALQMVGRDIYEVIVKGYSEKQWGRPCTALPPFLIRRLPLRFVFDNNYYNDTFQGIPVGGYNRLIDALLDGVETRVDTDFLAHREELASLAECVVYTGSLDAFYDFRFGPLQYRTVYFEQEVLDTPDFQGRSVVNYTDREVPYTRIIEHKHFECFGQAVCENPKTVISKEYSVEFKEGMERFFPINDESNTALYARYKALADREEKVFFGGRLADYRYHDMAPTIEQALALANRLGLPALNSKL